MARHGAIRSRKDLLEFERFLGRKDKELRKGFNKQLREAVKPTLRKTQEAALSFPARSESHSGLRRATARALGITTARGRVAIQIRRSRMPEGQEHLPNRMEGLGGKWRHPLFGNTRKWYTQPSRPWFFPTIKKDLPRVTKAIQNAISNSANDLGRF